MKKVFFLFLFFVPLWVLQTAFVSNNISFPAKKIHRSINKIWKIQNVDIELLSDIKHIEMGNFYRLKNNEKLQGYLYVGRVNSCRSGGCEIDRETREPSFEFFDYFVILDTSIVVKKVKIFNYQATHGHEVMSSGWLRQFIGYNGDEDLKYGRDIEAISGATISAKSLNADVQFFTKVLKKNILKEY
jgi:hypothetical protein